MKKILITGSTGFVGSNIFFKLKKENIIYLLLRKKTKFRSSKNLKIIYFKNFNELTSKLKKIKIDIIIHCATHYVKKHMDSDIEKISNSNIILGNILLDNLKKMKVKKFINFSTIWENYNGSKETPFNLYSVSKLAFKKFISYYANLNRNISFYNIYISDTYGLNDKRIKLINLLRYNYKNNKVTKLISKNLFMNLINIKDIIKGVELIINKRIKAGDYVLKNDKNFSVFKLISLINKSNNRMIKIKWNSSKLISEKIYNFKILPGWKPNYSGINDLRKFIINF